jgi:2-dehydro-3-deoxyglucarate aldolase
MTNNNIRRAVEAGEAVYGASAATFSPTMIEVFGDLGLDFVWLDLEHGGPSPYDSTALEELTRAADVVDIELLVRIPMPEPSMVRKVVDAGVRTVLIPRIETAEDLQPAVEAAYFSYDGDVGDRGVGIGRGSRWAGYADSHVGDADEDVLVGTMIENERALDTLDSILSVPQLGFAFLGPADMEMSMSGGDPLSKHPDAVSEGISDTLDACLDAGVPAGRILNDPDAAAEAVDDGFQIVRIGDDIGAVRDVLRERLGIVTE